MNDMKEISPEMQLVYASERLEYLAKCLYATGNEILADKLNNISIQVSDANKDIQTERAEELNDRLDASRQGTANMMNALFAGIEVGKGGKDA